MSDKFLTKEELEDLTGLTQGAAQIRWLLKRGVTHYVRADGRPRVPVGAVDGRSDAMPPGEQSQPDFGALRATR